MIISMNETLYFDNLIYCAISSTILRRIQSILYSIFSIRPWPIQRVICLFLLNLFRCFILLFHINQLHVMKKKLVDLFLSKETIAQLDERIMKQVKGGVTGYLSCSDMVTTYAAGCPGTTPPWSNPGTGCPQPSSPTGPCSSDIRFKKDIVPIENAVERLTSLNGYSYFWKKDEYPDRGFSEERSIGFIAQEVEGIFPEIVVTDALGYKSINYSLLVAVLTEGVKETLALVRSQRDEIAVLSSKIDDLNRQYLSIPELAPQLV